MTIAVGMRLQNEVILCSDSQITSTGYSKYSGQKVFSIHASKDPGWSVGLTYSGDPERMSGIYERLEELLAHSATVDREFVKTSFQTALTEARDSIRLSGESIDAVCGFVDADGKTSLFAGKNGVVSELSKWVILGAGDASLVRYLQKILPIKDKDNLSVAMVVNAYLIVQATEYIDGCGGKIQACVLRQNFRPYHISGGSGIKIRYAVTLLDQFLRETLSGVDQAVNTETLKMLRAAITSVKI